MLILEELFWNICNINSGSYEENLDKSSSLDLRFRQMLSLLLRLSLSLKGRKSLCKLKLSFQFSLRFKLTLNLSLKIKAYIHCFKHKLRHRLRV